MTRVARHWSAARRGQALPILAVLNRVVQALEAELKAIDEYTIPTPSPRGAASGASYPGAAGSQSQLHYIVGQPSHTVIEQAATGVASIISRGVNMIRGSVATDTNKQIGRLRLIVVVVAL